MNNPRQPLHHIDHDKAALRVHSALYEMLNGTAGRAEWSDLADAVNMIESLVHMKKVPGERFMPLINKAIDGLVEAIDCDDGRMRMHADTARAIRAIVCCYDECMEKLARQTLDEASGRVILKIAEQINNPDNGVRVVSA